MYYNYIRCHHWEKLSDGYTQPLCTIFTTLKSFKNPTTWKHCYASLGISQNRGPRTKQCWDLKVERTLRAPALTTDVPDVQPWLPRLWLLDLSFHESKREPDGGVGPMAGILVLCQRSLRSFIRWEYMRPKKEPTGPPWPSSWSRGLDNPSSAWSLSC